MSESQQTEKGKFNAERHLIELQGKAYLEIKWRIAWFRSAYPHGSIRTEELCVDLDRKVTALVPTGNWIPNPDRPGKKMPEKIERTAYGYARFKAYVDDGEDGHAEGTKAETAADFPDYVEKAETGSIGRALANLGYGTQFTGDELSEEHRIIDAPVERSGSYQYAASTSSSRATQELVAARDAIVGMQHQHQHQQQAPLLPDPLPPPKVKQPTSSENAPDMHILRRYAETIGVPLDGAEMKVWGEIKAEGNETPEDRFLLNAYLNQIAADQPATEQQMASLRKLRSHLELAPLHEGVTLTYASAKEMIFALYKDYNEQRQSRKAS